MNNEPSILIIHTGGTIGMVADKETGSLHPVRGEELHEHIPMLDKLNCHIEFYSFDPLMDSKE